MNLNTSGNLITYLVLSIIISSNPIVIAGLSILTLMEKVNTTQTFGIAVIFFFFKE